MSPRSALYCTAAACLPESGVPGVSGWRVRLPGTGDTRFCKSRR